MAKKKRKKRPPQRPAQRAGAATTEAARPQGERPASARAEKKEQARLERERRIRLARRRQRMRRATRWGAVLGVAGAITALVLVQVNQGSELEAAAAAAAERIGCGAVQTPTDEGTEHLQPGSPPPDYGTVPANSGPHDPQPLPSDPAVYGQPVPETAAVHNLEHGYVLIHYRAEGEGALPPATVDALGELVEDESEVIMAPYPELQEGTNLALVAWTRLLECAGEGEADDARLVAENFIEQFRNNSAAPEAEVS
jgi:hypothetical protein